MRVGGAVQQLAVVADEQHGLRRSRPAPPRASACPARRGSCPARRAAAPASGPAQQRLEREPLLLAAGQRVQHPVLAALERHAERRHRADVPEHLGVVAAGVAPVGERLRVAQLGLLVVALHHRQLGGVERLAGVAHGRRREVDAAGRARSVSSRIEPMNWRITPRPPSRATPPPIGAQVAGDEAQQRGLAGAVRADQRGLRAVADPEARRRRTAPARRAARASALTSTYPMPPSVGGPGAPVRATGFAGTRHAPRVRLLAGQQLVVGRVGDVLQHQPVRRRDGHVGGPRGRASAATPATTAAPPLAHRQHRADQRAHHRVAERVGA